MKIQKRWLLKISADHLITYKNMKTSITNADKQYNLLLAEIQDGQIQIPQFQRKFVWSVQASAKLIDSIIKGYPIGTFIFWRTNERLRSIRKIGNLNLPEPRDGEFINYVLDGQQRITSLYAAFKGETVNRGDGKTDDFSKICVNLDADPNEEDIVTVESEKKEGATYISVVDLLEGKMNFIFQQYPNQAHQDRIEEYKEIIKAYQFKGVNLQNASIDVATEVFTRLNVGGRELTLFEIMVAKTYDSSTNFDLEEKYQQLLTDLSTVGYDTLAPATVLQTISILITKDCTRPSILKLDKQAFIQTWSLAEDCIKKTVDYFRSYGIPVSNLLPYNALIVPFAYFFSKHPNNPSGDIQKRLEDFFWRCSLGYRYSSSVEGKLALDINKIDKILEDTNPFYEWRVEITPQFITEQGWFRTSKSFVKAILCVYCMHHPKSFNNNLEVQIDNNWLLRSNSKNYHHFYPKAYMKKEQRSIDEFLVNHVVNITIVDDYLNKRVIGAKAPSKYINEFYQVNPNIDVALESQMISPLHESGIIDNDFMKFFNSRLSKIVQFLDQKLIKQNTGDESYEDVDIEDSVEMD